MRTTASDPHTTTAPLRLALALAVTFALSAREASGAQSAFPGVPGVVIDHSPAASGIYIGSPSLAVLPDGRHVASHDEFGPKSTEHTRAVSHVFRSEDRGQTWHRVSTVNGAFWSSLFVHRGVLYLLGPDRHHGNVLIRRSDDGGATWTTPTNAASGLLRDDGEFHCAPMPVLEHAGRLWRAMERRDPPVAWGINYRAGMMSAPVDADLLHAASWTWAEFLPSDRAWNGGDMGAWLEGNAVVAPDGGLVNLLRVETKSPDEKAALVRVSDDGRRLAFDPATGFVDFPGGAKKFAIRRDPRTNLYWSLATIVQPRHRDAGRPATVRNTLALVASPDLRRWQTRCVLLHHPDVARHGFQYVDWQFDGDDLIAVCRTAFDDGLGGAHNNHDANFLTFHRWPNFRALTMADSVPVPVTLATRLETEDFVLTGGRCEVGTLTNGARAFSNRDYVWQAVPAAWDAWNFTRLPGGERVQLRVLARRDAVLTLATAPDQRGFDAPGWERLPGEGFAYTDRDRTRVAVFRRAVRAREEVSVPQGNWTGGILLWPR